MKLKDMPTQQRTVMILITIAIVAFSLLGFFAPRGSMLEWKMQRFLFFAPGLVVGYVLGVWVGSGNKKK